MFRIQRFTQEVVLPINYDTGEGADVTNLNGLLRGITIVAPNLSGTSYTASILGGRGEVLWSKSGLTEAAVTSIIKDADAMPLAIPLSLNDQPVLRIKSAGTGDATGTLTWANTTNIANNATVTIGGVVYTFKTTLTGAANEIKIVADVKAQGLIDCGATGPANGETFVIGATTYTIKTALSSGPTVANEILLEADVDDTLANIKAAITAGAGIGVKYSTGTVANASATATTLDDTAHTLLIEALAAGTPGNSIVFTESLGDTTFNGSGVLGGTQAGLYSGDASLTNLKKAINHEATEGTDYGTGTVANPYVTSAAVSSHAIVVTAVEGVEGGGDVNTLETSTVLSWGGAVLSGGGESAAQTFAVDLYIERG